MSSIEKIKQSLKEQKSLLIGLCFFILVYVIGLTHPQTIQEKEDNAVNKTTTTQKQEQQSTSEFVPAIVVRIHDGETITVQLPDGAKEKVRLIGIDAPVEDTLINLSSKDPAKLTLADLWGKTVYLEKDAVDRDSNGYLLRYVWLEIPDIKPNVISDSEVQKKMVNAILLLNGYGKYTSTSPNKKYESELARSEFEAFAHKKGIWSISTAPHAPPDSNKSVKKQNIIVYVTLTGHKYHRSWCRYLRYSKIPISLGDAINEGYEPCSVCNPPY
ncbi:prophage LambdaCh01, thermonuclease [Carboxydothermus islandicus]|uniref:Prophage LambdaCh01, thermonuclease n=1 Tax=Carboxydothermus islandicus TaxID=661089 RepID=A0A1L8D0U3_9THEO|nr:thermonuclease family protein [Carboxydothermus islandicus]GAV24764.1 prophage LambdaCh01, thermonuclease [Carboxydothermus islandicus]